MTKHNMVELLRLMMSEGASDLIITAGTPPQFRINGQLAPFGEKPMTGEETRTLIDSILKDHQIEEIKEARSLDFSREFEGLARFRFNVYFQKDTLAAAIRIIPFVIPNFEDLGLPGIIRELALRPHGLVLITGPAGSGKSTTMATMVDHINHTKNAHVVCIEDPIEYVHQHIRSTIAQREIGGDARSFTEALRCVFRQSPDVILIGEVRDLETMQLMLTLAETGHLILATLHTQDTTHSINRIVDSFPSDQQKQVYVQLSMVLQAVVSQQLLITKDEQRRVLATEILNVNNAVRNLIREMQVQQIYSVVQTGKSEGMITMNESLLQLCALDLIDPDLALARSPRPKELIRMFEYNQMTAR